MGVACALRREWARTTMMVAMGALASGCVTIQGGPERLYTVPQEVAMAQALLPNVEAQYAVATIDTDRMFYRNEYIARRMYVIDVEYSEYEAALTGERQKFGFATTTAASGLGIASTLTTPVRSAQILSGIGAAILATRGAFDSEVVIAKTLQIVQGHMRAQRDNVFTKQIFPRLGESAVTYPLSAALHDLEDYYRAGTFTAGLIPALREAGNAEQAAAQEKAIVVTFGKTDTTKALSACINRAGFDRARLVSLVTPPTNIALARLRFENSIEAEASRRLLLTRARAAGIC
jgi:hypothetical protein